MTPSVTLIGIVTLPVLVLTKCYPKLPVWGATYVRITVNAGDADKKRGRRLGNADALQTELVATLIRITFH